MIRNLLNGLRLGFAYFSVGTVIAQVVIIAVICVKYGISAEKCNRLIAHFRGVDPVDLIVQEKMAKDKQDELTIDLRSSLVSKRKEALKFGIGEVKTVETLIRGDQKQYDTIRSIFAKRLDELEATEVIESRKTVIQTLEVLEPELTKDLIMLMVEDVGAMEVGEIVAGIQRDRKTKIYAEFTTPEEVEVRGKIISAIGSGEGVPTTDEGEAL